MPFLVPLPTRDVCTTCISQALLSSSSNLPFRMFCHCVCFIFRVVARSFGSRTLYDKGHCGGRQTTVLVRADLLRGVASRCSVKAGVDERSHE
jgi:hypothetical protein